MKTRESHCRGALKITAMYMYAGRLQRQISPSMGPVNEAKLTSSDGVGRGGARCCVVGCGGD